MIFKVLYQPSMDKAIARERTQTIYVEAESEREVRSKLEESNYNIELIQALSDDHLAYEKKSDDFKVESL